MRFFCAAIIFFFICCVPTQQIIDSSIPQILIQYPLPAIPSTIDNPPTEISLALFITAEGSVTKARLIKGSCGSVWDSLALQTILRWQFTPVRVSDKPISNWFHLRAPVRYITPEPLLLAEIVCNRQKMIDSIYAELKRGQDFAGLAKRYSTVPSGEKNGELGEINIFCYPEYIRRYLTDLEPDEFTQPLKYGERFIIFMRLKK